MSPKAIILLCAQALLAQCALSQCTSRAAIAAAPGIGGLGLATNALAGPYGLGTSGLAGPYGAGALGTPGLAASYGSAALGAPGLASPCGWASPAMDFTPTSGGGLPVNSASGIAPVGISVASENAYEGALAVAGELPFVGTVGLEGVLPTAGAGAVNHACGNGRNAMISEGEAFAPTYGAYGAYAPAGAIASGFGAISPAAAIAPGYGGSALGYRAGYAGRGCGCAL